MSWKWCPASERPGTCIRAPRRSSSSCWTRSRGRGRRTGNEDDQGRRNHSRSRRDSASRAKRQRQHNGARAGDPQPGRQGQAVPRRVEEADVTGHTFAYNYPRGRTCALRPAPLTANDHHWRPPPHRQYRAHSSSRGRRRFEKLDRPLDRLPGEMSSGHVPRVKSRLAQSCHRLASDVKPIDAKRDDHCGLRGSPIHSSTRSGSRQTARRLVGGTTAGVPGPRRR